MKMIGDKRPAKTTGIGLLKNSANPVQKIIPVSVVLKDIRTLNPTCYDMMQRTRRIYSRLSWHDKHLAYQ
jgi:hypothetical protein